jgi:hypothetical protein
MNCQLFEDVVMDLVRDGEMKQTIRLEAEAHAHSCARCAARLAGERELTVLLKQPDDREAPAHLEESLVSAYRGRHGEATHARPLRRLGPRVYAAAAAGVILIVAAAATITLLHTPQPVVTQTAGKATAAFAPPAQTARTFAAAPLFAQTESPKQKAGRVQPRRAVPKPPPAEEIATDFIPLTYSRDISTLESCQVVRVLMPRTAMASFGLPVNQERMNIPVSAQVLIGQDGVARAIRFLGETDRTLFRTGLQPKR